MMEIFVSGPLKNNTIFFACLDTKKAAVIDPAIGSESFVESALKKHHLTLEWILLTHGHFDHIASVAKLKRTTEAKVAIHFGDAMSLEHPTTEGLAFFVEIESVKADVKLKEGCKIQVGHLVLEVIHTPGHTPGSVCYYLPKEKILFSGDTLFKGTIGKISEKTSQPDRMWDSLKKLAKLPKDTRVIPGHGSETTLGNEKWIERAEEFF